MQTLFIGQSLFFLHDVESTNTYASDLLKNVNPPEGAIVYTDNQTKGKGQRGSVWSSEIAKNVTVSIILKPTFLALNHHFYLSKITALALYDVLAQLLASSQYDIKIKWPNDILVDKKKIAGVLIENNVQQHGLQHSIIGIGLNVNQTLFHDLTSLATSLKLITEHEFDRKAVLETICQHLEKWYLKLKANHFEAIDEAYKQRLFKLNESMDFLTPMNDAVFRATITNVTKEGKLELKLENGTLQYFELKEVKPIF